MAISGVQGSENESLRLNVCQTAVRQQEKKSKQNNRFSENVSNGNTVKIKRECNYR